MNQVVSFKPLLAGTRMLLAALCVAVAWCGHVRAQLITDYVSRSLLATNQAAVSSPASAMSRVETDEHTLAVRPNALTAGERWEKFEAEFGITNRSSSTMVGSMESAKYQLDKSTFAIQEFANNVADALRFDYGWSDLTGSKPSSTTDPPQPNANPILDSLENARFKSDIDLNLIGGSFVGVKLVLPFGN